MLDLSSTLELVVRALALNRSIVAPAEAVRHGPLWVLRDASPRPGKARREELFAFSTAPDRVVAAARSYTPQSPSYALDLLLTDADDQDVAKAAYKSRGYRLVATESLMSCSLASPVPSAPAASPWQIRRVTTLEEMRMVSEQVYGRASRRLRPQDLSSVSPAIRMYWAEADGQAVAAARSLTALPGAACLHDVETIPDYRRRGIATALLQQILADDARDGVRVSALLASRAGALLYPRLGYRERAILQMYVPAPRRATQS